MTVVFAAVGFLWPFADASVVEGVVILLYVGLILAVVPVGWLLIKRGGGLGAAGPLWPLLFFMVLACLYALATPPWQTPDEPRHMVYVELVRQAGPELPAKILAGRRVSAEDASLVAEVEGNVLDSLRKVDTWPDDAQNIIDSGQIPGPDELTHPPLYYEVAAVVAAPLGGAPILARLAVLRAFGIMIGGWIVWLCGRAGRLLWPERPRLAEAPMVVAAGIPTFVAFAGTVNSDVLANFFAAAVLVVVVLLVLRQSGRRWGWVLVAVGLVFAGVMAKRSFLPLVPVVGLAILMRSRWTARSIGATARSLGAIVAIQLVAAVALLSFGMRPALWRSGAGVEHGCQGGRIGDSALCGTQRGVSQQLTVATIEEITGRPVTVGFWAFSNGPGHVTLYVGSIRSDTLTITEPGWNFARIQFIPPAGQRELRLTLYADVPAKVDGILLVKGKFTPEPPTYEDDSGSRVRWDGRRVQNLLENGSGEDTVAAAPVWLPENVRRTMNGVGDAAYSVFRGDRLSGSWPFIRYRLGETFGIFWGSMGWDQPPRLFPTALRWLLAGFVAVGVAAAAVACAGRRRLWPVRAAVAMIAAVLFGVLAVVLRGIPPTDVELVSGRYLFPFILAVAVVLVAGWRRILTVDDRRFRTTARWFAVGTHLAFIATVFIPFRWG